jgi:hypothetical protein
MPSQPRAWLTSRICAYREYARANGVVLGRNRVLGVGRDLANLIETHIVAPTVMEQGGAGASCYTYCHSRRVLIGGYGSGIVQSGSGAPRPSAGRPSCRCLLWPLGCKVHSGNVVYGGALEVCGSVPVEGTDGGWRVSDKGSV